MSDSNADRLTFEQARRELQISEAELEKLVASGEIASVKDGDTFFFKPAAIAQYRKSMKTEPSIVLSDDEVDLLDDVDEIVEQTLVRGLIVERLVSDRHPRQPTG